MLIESFSFLSNWGLLCSRTIEEFGTKVEKIWIWNDCFWCNLQSTSYTMYEQCAWQNFIHLLKIHLLISNQFIVSLLKSSIIRNYHYSSVPNSTKYQNYTDSKPVFHASTEIFSVIIQLSQHFIRTATWKFLIRDTQWNYVLSRCLHEISIVTRMTYKALDGSIYNVSISMYRDHYMLLHAFFFIL